MITKLPAYISVIIPVLNTQDIIRECLDAVLEQDYPKDSFEVIVVDNGSTDNTAEIVRQYAVRYVFEPQKGKSIARNRGAKEAKGEILAFLDCDNVVPPEWLRVSSQLMNNLWIAAVQANIRMEYESAFPEKFNQGCYYVPFLNSAVLLVRKQVFSESGGFDNRMNQVEDIDLSFRILACGYALAWIKEVEVLAYRDLTPWQAIKRGWSAGIAVSRLFIRWRNLFNINQFSVYLNRVRFCALHIIREAGECRQRVGIVICEQISKLISWIKAQIFRVKIDKVILSPTGRVAKLLGSRRFLVVAGDNLLIFDSIARRVDTFKDIPAYILRYFLDGVSDEVEICQCVVKSFSISKEAACSEVDKIKEWLI